MTDLIGHNETAPSLEDAYHHLIGASRYGFIEDQMTRDHVERAHDILRDFLDRERRQSSDYMRVGNQSPDYLLRQDQYSRASSGDAR